MSERPVRPPKHTQSAVAVKGGERGLQETNCHLCSCPQHSSTRVWRGRSHTIKTDIINAHLILTSCSSSLTTRPLNIMRVAVVRLKISTKKVHAIILFLQILYIGKKCGCISPAWHQTIKQMFGKSHLVNLNAFHPLPPSPLLRFRATLFVHTL